MLTWKGGNLMELNATWRNIGGVVHNGTSDICFQGTLTYDAADAGKPITVNSGWISFWGPSKAIPFSLVVNANTSMRANSGAATWSGPVTVAAGKEVSLQANGSDKTLKITGVLSGAGKVTVNGGGGKVYLDNAANTWSGGFAQTGSTVYPKTAGSLPGYDQAGKVSFSGGTMVLSQPTGWTPAQMKTLDANMTWTGGTLCLDGGSSDVTYDWTFRATPAIYQFIGSGGLSLPNTDLEMRCFQINGRRWTVPSSVFDQKTMRDLVISSGTVTLDGAGCLFTTNCDARVGGSSTGTARLVLTNGASLHGFSKKNPSKTTVVNEGYNKFNVGGTGTGPAIVELYEGCSLTGKVYAVSGGKSAWYLRGGDFVQFTGPTADGYISYGANGYGYIGQTAGRFMVRAHTGIMAAGSTGIYDLKGGEFCYIPGMSGTCNFTLSRGYGKGILYQTGGVYNAPGHSLYMGIQDYSDTTGGLAVATLNGPNALMKVNNVDLGLRLTNFTSIVNLMNGGVLQTKYIEHATKATRVNSEGYVNFNGGVFRPAGANEDIFGSGVKIVKQATVFAGGVVFDNASYNCGVGQPYLKAPTGKGIAAIAIPSSATKTGYYGSPEVEIKGDGFGATAYCEFNDRTGVIGPIVVTSPGWNYTTATATIKTANRSGTVSLTVTLANNVSGGLVKLGGKMLTLKGADANTYAGETIVSNGTLRLLTARCIPVTNDVHVAGGILDLGGVTVHQLGRLGGFGTVTNGTVALQGLSYDAAELLDNFEAKATLKIDATAAVTLPAGAPVTIRNPDLLPAVGRAYPLATAATAFPSDLALQGLPVPWKLSLSNEGKTLKLVYVAGTTVILR